ncbi:hypothetical protein JQ629_13590 [Bradyrhizobium sp. AUGA SZCCT0222]|uniref:hypothetical protein n=1 Tax=Bradyrhizobium sp. AUGA SZCCT0222 TaxID=2807668 RepID=UPI001BA61E73|nr:hypothetical protein [Bradyrhizobium sp. AUGA SZCCT0222]MBR1268547.1 hypothetical protein [Bradyrhizobium sp. AUGA SZCCT0222]
MRKQMHLSSWLIANEQDQCRCACRCIDAQGLKRLSQDLTNRAMAYFKYCRLAPMSIGRDCLIRDLVL